MSFAPFADALRALAAALRDAHAEWYLFGAQAALVYGSARLTADIDITVRMTPEEPELLAQHLERHSFRLRVQDPSFVRQTRVLPVVHEPSTINVDIVLAGPGLEELFLSRAVQVDIEGVRLPIARAEDLQDVESIVAAQDGLDIALVTETLMLLEEALDQSDLVPAFESIRQRVRGR